MSFDYLISVVHILSHLILSQYKTKNISSFYSVSPQHACECAHLLSSDHLFLQISWNRSHMLFCVFSCRMYWHPVHVVSDCITFNMLYISIQQMSYFFGQWKDDDEPSGCMNLIRQSLLSSVFSITTPITTFQHSCAGWSCDVIVCNMSRSWMLP
jgi:hypothetical protein